MDITNVLRAHGIGVGKKLVGNAQPSDVRAGKTFSNVDGNDKVGTLAERGGARTITPGTTNQVLQSGIYDGAITVQGDPNLVPANILSGKTIFGITGTVIAGKRSATGTVTLTNWSINEIKKVSTGLSWTPTTLVVRTSAPGVSSSFGSVMPGSGEWGVAGSVYVRLPNRPVSGATFDIENSSTFHQSSVTINWLVIE